MEKYDVSKSVSQDDFVAYVEYLWENLDPKDRAKLPKKPVREIIRFENEGRGLEPFSTLVVGGAIAAGSTVLHDVWKKILLPKLERRFGTLKRTSDAARTKEETASRAKFPSKKRRASTSRTKKKTTKTRKPKKG